MHRMYREWLRDALKESGKTNKQLADHLRLDPSAVTRMLNGERQIKSIEIPPITRFLRVAPPKEFGSLEIYPTQQIKVGGIISAGVWRDTSITDLELEELPVVQQGDGVDRYALKVEGDSANLIIPDGSYAICVAYWYARSEIKDGDLVHVERTRGGLVEATIKRVRKANGNWELHPESDNPKHSGPIPYESSDIDQVEIKGLVVARYSAFDTL